IRILGLPAVGELDRKAQLGVEEVRAAEEALPRVHAEGEAVYPLEVLLLVALERSGVDAERVEPLLGDRDPLLGIRVGSEEARQAPALSAHAAEDVEHVDHGARIVAFADHVLEAQLVGLPLGVASVAQEQHAEPGARDLSVARDVLAEDAADAEPEGGELLAAHLLDGVAR